MMKKSSKFAFICLNLLIAVLLCVAFLVIIVLSLKKYTDHGHEIEVPQITGLYPHEAEFLLSESNLHLEIIDSTFSKKVPLGTIVEQTPVADSHVKTGRAIYVVINASTLRQVTLPELHDVSYRQAVNILQQLGLKVYEIIYEPSEYKDLVLDLRMHDVSLQTGQKISEGSPITVVVGQGHGTEMMAIPDVTGLNIVDVRSALLSEHFTMGYIEFDEEPTADNRNNYVVYSQDPSAGTMAQEGSAVNIALSLDRKKSVTTNTVEDEDEFF